MSPKDQIRQVCARLRSLGEASHPRRQSSERSCNILRKAKKMSEDVGDDGDRDRRKEVRQVLVDEYSRASVRASIPHEVPRQFWIEQSTHQVRWVLHVP